MATEKQTFIFIGRSGCGKGTQAELLIGEMKDKSYITDQNPLFYIETGDRFRDFISKTSNASRLAKDIMDRSERQPDFLAIWMWADLLVTNLMGDEHLVFDGTPRSLNEALALDTALKFYQRQKPTVIYLDVTNEWSKTRMLERGRIDDKKSGDIEKRLAWFESDVLPAVKYYENNPNYHFVRVNGEQTIEAVHSELMSELGW